MGRFTTITLTTILKAYIQRARLHGRGDVIVIQKEIVEAGDEWSPPADKPGKSSSDAEILRVIDEFKIAYPNEIVAHTGISQQTVLGRLGYLRNQGVIERVVLGLRPSDEFKARLPGLWDQGLKGATLKRMSWYRRVDREADKKK